MIYSRPVLIEVILQDVPMVIIDDTLSRKGISFNLFLKGSSFQIYFKFEIQ